MKKLTTEEFIQKSLSVHGDRYDYTTSVYVLSSRPLNIKCKHHGTFSMRPNDHLRGQGCPQCGDRSSAAKRRSSNFIEQATKIHGSKYTYDKVDYVNTHTKVTITCPRHGDFKQKPNCHISQKNGCPICARSRHPGRYTLDSFLTAKQRKIRGIFYAMEFSHGRERFIKIGITTTSAKQRHMGKTNPYKTQVLIELPLLLYQAFEIENHLKQQLKHLRHNPKLLQEGQSECFIFNALNPIRRYCQLRT